MTRSERRRLVQRILSEHWRDVWRFTHRGLRVETPDGRLIAFYEGI